MKEFNSNDWMTATEELQNKYIHYLLDLNYSIDNVSGSILTNTLISKVLNDLLKFVESQPNKVFVYDYNDDLPSLVGYKILILLNAQHPFDFRLLKKSKILKAKNTKKQLAKGQKFISEKKIINNPDKYALISSFNPIYEVIDVEKNFKDFGLEKFNLIQQFTPSDFINCQQFYGIKRVKDFFTENLGLVLGYSKNINNLNEGKLWSGSLNPIDIDKVNVVWVDGDQEKAIKTLQDVEESYDINFYFYDDEDSVGVKDILFSYNFSFYLKHKFNIPSERYQNINNYKFIKYCKTLGIKLNLVGFSTEQYFKFIEEGKDNV